MGYKANDLAPNVIINPNPSYHPVKRESNVYEDGPQLEPTYDEIGKGTLVINNPAFCSTDKSENEYVVSAEELIDYCKLK